MQSQPREPALTRNYGLKSDQHSGFSKQWAVGSAGFPSEDSTNY